MSYKNAAQILPTELLREIQKYVDGEFIYIPRSDRNRREWGTGTTSRQELRERNRMIYRDHLSGIKSDKLAEKYFLSKKSIERIITRCRKNAFND